MTIHGSKNSSMTGQGMNVNRELAIGSPFSKDKDQASNAYNKRSSKQAFQYQMQKSLKPNQAAQ